MNRKFTVIAACMCGCGEHLILHKTALGPRHAARIVTNAACKVAKRYRIVAVFAGHIENQAEV